MPRREPKRPLEAVTAAALGLFLVLLAFVSPAFAKKASSPPPSAEDAIAAPAPLRGASADEPSSAELQLEVTVNSTPTKKIEAFVDLGAGRLAATRRALEEVGINPPGASAPDQLIELDSLPEFAYFYDVAGQRIDIVASDRARIRRTFDATNEHADRDPARADYGAVLNYSIYATGSTETTSLDLPLFNGLNTTLDSRVITPYGVLNQTGIVGQTATGDIEGSGVGALRLDTTWTVADEENMVLYNVGDVISGGPDWSRPVRMGGVQAQRSFRLRPDLVTQALPSFSGSAAVPSTVDVYVNNAKAYSKDVGSGPFQIDNMPTINGAGSARVVVRDAAGRETEQTLDFYGSQQLLRPGLVDFSVETGVVRYDYGINSMNYDESPVGSGSIRAGLYDDLTVEGHAEGGKGLVNVGAGVTLRAGIWGVGTLAGSVSDADGKVGYQLYASGETTVGPVIIRGKTQHAFGDYEDLASVTSRGHSVSLPDMFAPGGLLGIEPARSLDQIGFNVPIEFIDTTLAFNFVHYEGADGNISNIVSATVSRPLFRNASMYATGYTDLEDNTTAAVFAGINMSLGDGYSVSTGASTRSERANASVEASKSLTQEVGSVGWHLRDYEGDDPYRSADLSYRTASGLVTGSIRQDTDRFRGSVELTGAVAAIDGDVYTSNRIDDAFAVVDAGAPGVRVRRENNVVGETDENGKILIPNLGSYQTNKIEVDPLDLPLDAEVAESKTTVTPAYHSGVNVNFNVKKRVKGAIVVLKDVSGKDLPPGSEVRLEGSSEPFVVGYDGETYITGLAAENTITVSIGDHACQARFAYRPSETVQQTIGPEVCQ